MRIKFIIYFVSLAVFSFGFKTWAYYEVLDNGEILDKGKFKATGYTQLLTQSSGANVGAIVDTGFNEEYGGRALIGVGKTDYYFGAMVKWMPIPDVDAQPTIGFNAGVLFAKWLDNREMTFRWEPLISKRFAVDQVGLTPYASLPLGLQIQSPNHGSDSTNLIWQLVLGTQVDISKFKQLKFIGEIGIDLNKAPAYLSAGAIWYF